MVEISVIMPVYNCEEYLKDSIESILNQTFEDFEFICVDDGSTDASLDILQEYSQKDTRMQVFHQENQGGGTARNFALKKAKGKYLLFIDSDDILCENALKETHTLIIEKNVDFLIFKAINYDNDEDKYFEDEYFAMNKLYNHVKDNIFSYNDIGNLIFNISATPWGKLYNLDFIKKCGAQFAEGIIFHDNKFFWDMLFASEKIYFHNKKLYVHIEHSTSIQGSKDKRFLNIFPAFKGIQSVFIKHGNLERYKERFFNWQVGLLDFRFYQIQNEYKNIFIDEFKKRLLEFNEDIEYDDLMNILDARNKKIYENVFHADSAKEYILLMENYNLSNSLENLKNNNIKLKKENKSLKKKNKKLKNKLNTSKKFSDELLNSTSWKITKPLRKFKNLRK